MLHRDLKPSNILLDSQGRPQLTDFGLAKLIDRPRPGSSSMDHTLRLWTAPTFKKSDPVVDLSVDKGSPPSAVARRG